MDDELAQIRQRRVDEMMRTLGSAMGGGGARGVPAVVDESTLGPFLENHPVALLDVWAAWCGPCRMMEPVVEELAHEYQGKAGIGKLDADQNPDFLAGLGIMSIPTFLFFKDG